MTDTPKLLKPAEVCEQLSINNDTMHRLIESGKLRAVKLGPKSTRVYEDSLQELLKNGDQNA